MNIVARYGIASIVTLLFLLSITYGGILPFIKAKKYIEANQELRTGEQNIQTFVEKYREVFQLNSPVGQEETVYFWATDVSGIIRSNPPAEVTSILLEEMEQQIDKENMRQMVVLATTYEIAWRNYRIKEYADRAIGYYEEIQEQAPLLPQALYGLLRVHYELNNTGKVEVLGTKILELWPTDEKVKEVLNNL